MSETYTQMKARLWEAAGESCEACTKHLSWERGEVEIHHVLHRAQHSHLIQDEDNCVIICRTCHDLDRVGRLRSLLISKKGQEWYDRLISKRGVTYA